MPVFEDFAATFAHMSEPELLHLAHSYDTLVVPAQDALRAEFTRRQLDPPLIDPDPVDPRTLVTIRRYRDLSEAIVARSLLESASIAVYLQDENLVRLDWQVSNFIGGLRLQVDMRDAAAANELLALPVPDPIAFADEASFPQPRCPRCGSIHITFEGASRGGALTSLYLAALPLPTGAKTWLCDTCGARWENTEDV